MGVFLVNKTQNPLGLPYPFRGFLPAGGKVPVNLTVPEALTALALVSGQSQRYIGIEDGAVAPFNDLVAGDALQGLLIGALQNPLPLQNVVFVEVLADFPTPVAGVITLSSGTLYVINGAIDILSNRLVRGANTHLAGFSSGLRDSITSTTSGALITNPVGESSAFEVVDLTLVALSGTVFDIGGSPTQLLINECGIVGDIGVFSGVNQIFTRVRFNSFSSGLTFSVGGQSLEVSDCKFDQAVPGTGICVDLGANVWSNAISIKNNVFAIAVAGVGISGQPANGNFSGTAIGGVSGNLVTALGTTLAGITASDLRWIFGGNFGDIQNTLVLGQYGFSANVTPTATTAAFTKILGTTVPAIQKRFLHVADNRMNYLGITQAALRIDVTVSASKTGGAGVQYAYTLFKNGSQLGGEFPGIVDNKSSTTSFVAIDEAATTTDFYDVRVRNIDNTDAITVTDLSVFFALT